MSRPFYGGFMVEFEMKPDLFFDLIAHPEHRVQRCLRVLEYHGYLVAPDLPRRAIRERQQIFAVEKYLSAYYFARRAIHQAQDRKRSGGFSAPGITYQAQTFSLLKMKS